MCKGTEHFMLISYIRNVQIDGPKLVQYGFKDAIAKVGLAKLISNFFVVGLFYHLYNQVDIFMAYESYSPLVILTCALYLCYLWQ